MKTPAQIIHEYVLDRMEDEPLPKQIKLYKALAGLAATPAERSAYHEMAHGLVSIHTKHRQLALDFKRRAEG